METSLVAQSVRNLPEVQETRVWSLGQEDLLEKEMANHSSILAWKIPWTEKPGRLKSMGWQTIRHDWATHTHTHTHTHNQHNTFYWAPLVPQLVKNLLQCRRPGFNSWVRKIPWRRNRLPTPVPRASLVTQTVKNLSTLQKTWVQSLGWEDYLEKGTATHSIILARRILMDRGPWWATVHGVTKCHTWLSTQAHSINFRCTT